MRGRGGNVSEVFVSFQGEGVHAGRRHLFVRLGGCPLRCRYCDTPESLVPTAQCRILGPDELRPRLSFLSGDFRRDYLYTLAAAEDAFGPVAFGCFSELDIFRSLQGERSWAAWLRALAVRDVIVTPTKGPLAGPLAADAAVWASAAANSLGKRWESLGLVLSLWQKWR